MVRMERGEQCCSQALLCPKRPPSPSRFGLVAWEPTFWVLIAKINLKDVLKIDFFSPMWPSVERKIFYLHQNQCTSTLFLLPLEDIVPNEQAQPGSFSRESNLEPDSVAVGKGILIFVVCATQV